MNNTGKAVSKQNSKWDNTLKTLNRQKLLFVLIAPAIVLTIIFSYIPMVGIKMAFQDYNIYMPEASEWIGFKNFIDIFTIKEFTDGIKNTVIISLLNLLICFPAGIVFALLLNEIKNTVYKKVIQTVSYLPHFLSWISVIGIVTSLFSEYGIINDLLVTLTGGAHERTMYLAEQWFFIPNVIILSLWKGVGWGSIVFLAAITGIDQSLYEAAKVDGASRLRQVWSITIPGILPTIMIMLLWQLARLFGDNFELIYGLQNPFVNVEVIGTIVYKNGIAGGNYQMTTAFGLMQGVVNFAFLMIANYISKKGTDVGIF